MRFPCLTVVVTLAALASSRPAAGSWADPQAGRPAMRIYGPSDYGSSADLWSVARDRRGRVYLGADRIYELDGRTWRPIEVDAAFPVRSMAAGEDGRIWVGAAGDLGYLDEDAAGRRSFVSLKGSLPDGVQGPEVWSVFRQDGRTLFVCESSLLVWDGARFEVQALPALRRLIAFPYREGIAISQDVDRLLLWRAGRLEKLSITDLVKGTYFFRFDSGDGSELLGVDNRLHRVAGPTATELPAEALPARARGLFTMAARLPDGSIAVATINGGVFFFDDRGNLLRVLDRSAGLPSDNCTSLLVDDEEQLWIVTTRGLACVDARHRLSLFDGSNGLSGGAVSTIVPHGGRVVAVTEEGLAELQGRRGGAAAFAAVPGADRYFSDGIPIESGEVLLGTIGSIWVYDGAEIRRVLRGLNTFGRLAADPSDPRFVVAAEASSLAFLDVGAGVQRLEPPVARLPEEAVDIAFAGDGTLWAATPRHGFYSVRGRESVTAGIRNWPLPAEAPLRDPRLFALGGAVYAYDDRQVVRAPGAAEDGFAVELAGLGLMAVERSATREAWAVTGQGREHRLLRLTRTEGGALAAALAPCRGLERIGRATALAQADSGRTLWIAGTTGALRLDLSERGDSPVPSAPRVMLAVWTTDKGTEPLPLDAEVGLAFAKEGVISFEIRDADSVLGGAGRLEARLAGREKAWTPAELARTYAGLREGGYELQVRAVDALGRASPVTSYAFTIHPPWFRSMWAFAAYGIAALAGIAGGVRLWMRRIQRLNLELERLVRQRTEELTRAVTARTAFLANMGHEIRNPLNGVVGLVDSLRAMSLPEQAGATLNRLGTCASQLVSVVEDVLEFSRVDAGRVTVRPQPFEVREPVAAAIDIFRAAKSERTIRLEADEGELAARVIGDPVRIRQVLVNYLANALKFAPDGAVTVTVEQNGDNFVFAVHDQGPGIPRDEQARLFMRFSRGGFAQREGIPGTGLGLAACRAYAEAMGGEVWVESEPGRGAAFHLRVPLRPAREGEALPTTVLPDVMTGRSVLIVDDHDFNRVVLSDLLGRMGAVPTAVGSVAEAQEAFAASVPDVVFVDFDLAGATGPDLARWIRHEAPAGRDVPVVATSAFEVEEVRRRCTEAGMDGFISKPVTMQKVAETMSRIEIIRTGAVAPDLAGAETAPPPVGAGFLDLMSDGDPVRRKELEKSAWREVATEAAAALRNARRGNLPDAGRHAHRLTSAAVMLALPDVVAAARELTGAARAGGRERTAEAARVLREALVAAKRHSGR